MVAIEETSNFEQVIHTGMNLYHYVYFSAVVFVACIVAHASVTTATERGISFLVVTIVYSTPYMYVCMYCHLLPYRVTCVLGWYSYTH